MNKKYATALAGVFIITLGTMAHAGSPNDPHSKRDMVQANKDVQQAANGPSGFGKRISMRAKGKSDADPFRNFGDYLGQMTDAPNPANDKGAGND